ncbi:hypothetical protein TNCV_1108461 [Trichonephila clavipes]|nr:hypothetical protein TNCV_1108461 [Trichonephila clavipes]
MGAGSLFTIMTASMGVGTPARAQTINNGPMATCKGHLTTGEAIKFSENRWVTATAGSDVVQSGRPIFDDNTCGRISAITRRMLSSKWSSVCGLSA